MLMRWLLAMVVMLVAPTLVEAGSDYDKMGANSPKIRQSDDSIVSEWDETAAAKKVTQATLLACEDVLNNICVVEERYSVIPTAGTNAWVAVDTLIKSGPGYVKDVTCYSDAAATAGNIKLYDNTAAGSGNVLLDFDVLAADYSKPVTVPLQTSFAVGAYLDFTTTADMKCMVRYR